MVAILWGILIAYILLADYNMRTSDYYPLLGLLLLIVAIVATVKKSKEQKEQREYEKETQNIIQKAKREASYIPPVDSTAAKIRAAGPPPKGEAQIRQERELRWQERQEHKRQQKEAEANQIIEKCQKASHCGERSLTIPVGVESAVEDSRAKEPGKDYASVCPNEQKWLRDELVRRGFKVKFTKSYRKLIIGAGYSAYYEQTAMHIYW